MRNNINLDLLGVALQLYNLILLMQDFNNNDLMQELQKQDKEYLETILKNQKEIIQLLKERR